MTPEEMAKWDAEEHELQAKAAAQRAKIAELRGIVAKSKQLLEEVFDLGTFGLTPELYVEALRLREALNERRDPPGGRRLFLPAGSTFVGPKLVGFDVTIVDRPIATGPSGYAGVVQ
jgi:hypothetical protein